jgi:hypothetical protein
MTLRPAEILGVSNQLGSIEVGKIANLTVTRGDLFDKTRRITHVFIDGRPVDLRPAATGAPATGANASGTWTLNVNLSGSGNEKQEFTATLSLQQQGERLTGSLQGQLGSGSIANGAISGADVNFTVPITLPAPASQTTDAIFNGSIAGGEMRGTVQIVGRGGGAFTATRAGGPPAGSATPPAGSATPPASAQTPAAASAAQPAATAGAAKLSGTWTLTSTVGPQEITSTLTLEQQGERLSGHIDNERFGASEISDGTANGDSFRFSTTANFGGQSISLSYEGTVSGNRMSGTVTTPHGAIAFSGTRNP